MCCHTFPGEVFPKNRRFLLCLTKLPPHTLDKYGKKFLTLFSLILMSVKVKQLYLLHFTLMRGVDFSRRIK